MVSFTLRQLEYAVAVARHGGFGAAARACHVSQPSLSAQVAQLEAGLGGRLFERGARGVALTPIGAHFVPRARDLLRAASDLADAAQAQLEPFTGELRLGVIPTVAPFLLPSLVPRLHDRYPACRVTLVESTTADLGERLARGELDVLLLALEAPIDGCETIAVMRDRFVVAVCAEHELGQRDEPLALDELPRGELLLLEEGHCLSRQVEEACRLGSTNAVGDFRASSLVTLVQMVAAGRGVTLLPGIACDSELASATGLVLRELRDDAYRTIGLAWRKGSPRKAEFEKLAALVDESAP